jgi:hypothetical protein
LFLAYPLALLPSFSKLHVNTVQPEDGFKWTVDKISLSEDTYGLMQGVRWNIPKKMFQKLGWRLTGSLATCFIPSQVQRGEQDIPNVAEYKPKPVMARAELHQSRGNKIRLPDPNKFKGCEFVELYIAPRSQKQDPPARTQEIRGPRVR